MSEVGSEASGKPALAGGYYKGPASSGAGSRQSHSTAATSMQMVPR